MDKKLKERFKRDVFEQELAWKEFFGYSKSKLLAFIIVFILSGYLLVIRNSIEVFPQTSENPFFVLDAILMIFFPTLFLASFLEGIKWSYSLLAIVLIINLVYLWILSCILSFLWNKFRKK